MSLPATQEPFPFLELPAEIRNKIYRLVLLTQNVTTEIQKDDDSGGNFGKRAVGDIPVQPNEVAIGTIRCGPWRKYILEYQFSILRVNRQINFEAWGIFYLENFWVVVVVNKAGFGREMKDRGFPVTITGDLWSHIRSPVMEVEVLFPSLEGQKQCDAFVMAAAHLYGLTRALWTAKGASEMKLQIRLQPPITNSSPSELNLLRQFFSLRIIKQVSLLGVSKQKYKDLFKRTNTTTDGLNKAFHDLAAGIRHLRRYMVAERWGHASMQVEKHVMLLTDCGIVYGSRFLGIEPGLDIITAIARSVVAKAIIVATNMGIAEVSLQQRLFGQTINFAGRAIELLSRASVVERANPSIVVPSNHPLLVLADTITYDIKSTQSFTHLMRASAYMNMRQGKRALQDIKKARELRPNSLLAASMSQTWKKTFGPFKNSGSLLPAASSSSTPAASITDPAAS